MAVLHEKFTAQEIFELKERLFYDEETGIFTYKKDVAICRRKGYIAGHKETNGYIRICINRKKYSAHRLAWLFIYEEQSDLHIDHLNGNKADNAIKNLRLATNSENGQNQIRAQSDNKIGVLGVSYKSRQAHCKNPFYATIKVNGKQMHLGSFSTSELAHTAYIAKKREIHPFFVEAA